MKKEKRTYGIILEVAIFFLIGIITTGLLTYVSETRLNGESVLTQTERHAAQVANEVRLAVQEYPAYRWLIQYWYAHADTLEIEYDVGFGKHTETEQKSRTLSARHPKLQLRYLDAVQCNTLPPEDQKLYAEITYSWLINRINQIKRTHRVDFLFCVICEEPYDHQFFLFSAADPGATRGTSYEEVYPLGHTVAVSESQTIAMRSAIRYSNHLADAGNYLDYYTSLCSFGDHSVQIGLTYDLSSLRAEVRAQTRVGAALAILNQLTLSLICLGLILLFVLRPLKKVQNSIRSYKRTKDSAAVKAALSEVRTRNEIGQLSEDVTDLATEIDDYVNRIESITAERERISTEMALATRIQSDMLPSVFPPFPGRTDFDIYASMTPAKEVGGDFYDCFLIDDDHLCVLIADVSGKGVPAALFMMMCKILLQTIAMSGKSPAETLESLNDQICAGNREEMFVTVWLGILDLKTGLLTAANAGHEKPFLMQPDGSFALFKDRNGFVIGGMPGIRYQNYEIQLRPGAKLFLYTDGVLEATDQSNALFGKERAESALNEVRTQPPREILENVKKRVDEFVGSAPQFDDLTMLCVVFFGENGDTDSG